MLTGICFIVSAAHLFFTGSDTPYSRERGGDYLYYLTLPSVLTVIFAVLGAILAKADPEDKCLSPAKNREEALLMLSARIDMSSISDAGRARVLSIRRKRICVKVIADIMPHCALRRRSLT